MIRKGIIHRTFSQPVMRGLAVTLVLSLLTQLVMPTCAYALTSGPSQPEVQSFEQVGTSDMVDMFSGDFSYNIPLLDVDGYPINISYQSGVGMDDEASWTGLGWNINAGVINRGVRGIPDDFSGDLITKETQIKPNRTFGLTGGASVELFGTKFNKDGTVKKADNDSIGGSAGLTLGFNYNNYRGMGVEASFNLSLSASVPGKGSLNGGLGLTSSSENGLTMAPNVSFSATCKKKESDEDKGPLSLGLKVGTAVNTRSGLKKLSITTSLSRDEIKMKKATSATSRLAQQTSAVFNFGGSTYTPTVNPNMGDFSVTGNFKFGGELFGAAATFDIGGYYSQQKLKENTVSNKAFGYLHHQDANIYRATAITDFNRENDASFTQNTPALPLAFQTCDMYSVMGQGVGGSYRPVRSDISYVTDATAKSTSNGFDIGIELGVGNTNHNGGDLTVTHNNSTSGMWDDQNLAKAYLEPKSTNGQKTYETYYFKEANEKTIDGDEFYNETGGASAVRVELKDEGDFNVVANNRFQIGNNGYYNIPVNTKAKREKRNQVIYPLTKTEVANGGGLETLRTGSYASTSAPGHHIAEITTYTTDGARYVYGLPVYNTLQKEITFAVGATPNNNNGLTGSCNTGLVSYNTDDNSLSNKRGLDNYYSSTSTPAFAHSYLLTAVLSSDYIDADNIQGPSEHDFGYYTKFYYERINNYKWRTPYGATNTASYNEGIRTDANDDKANIIYGEKELYYLDSIVTKNYIAIFYKSNREDGFEAGGENGGTGSQTMKKLDKISLYSRWDYKNNPATAVPLKEVHFVYDYELCDDVPNNPTGGGKLTLKEIYFTYQNSEKARFSSYKFEYNGPNPNYNYKAYDRWGNYKAMPGNPGCGNSGDLIPAEFPYVEQDTAITNPYMRAWLLTDIRLPSGGKIHVDYESDDYQYVQHKKATQMFRVAGYGSSFPSGANDAVDITADGERIYFDLADGDDANDINRYVGDMSRIYFRFLMETNNTTYDYVSGYFNIEEKGVEYFPSQGKYYGYVVPQAVDINDAAASQNVNPITKAAIQYCRLNLPRLIYNQPAISDNDDFDEQLLNSLVSVVSNFSQAAQGENAWILNKGKCETAVLKKSWMRLYNPFGNKLGGGSRVKKIVMTDEWDAMTNSEMDKSNYGQEYFYTLEDGTSSGVASYEPQIGGDENVWKQPIYTNEKNLLAPDNEHYTEEPFGESLFPGASVGYSRVTVRNLQRNNVTRHATGKVVHEFYTAKDFPTIVERTGVLPMQDKTDPFSIASVFYVQSKDYMTASQGFSIELNDMHGKPKKQSVYQEGKPDPVTTVEYKYKSQPYLTGSSRLVNEVAVIQPDGTISNKNIGMVFDMCTDFRQSRSVTNSAATMVNLDGFIWPFPPVYIPWLMFLPSVTHEETQFRSVTTTKVIQRFGILEETIARDLGSVVSTKNVAYDSETGDVLLTQTKTDYNDDIYSMSYPAHWHYDGMGQAYKNLGVYYSSLTFTSGTAPVTNANQYFTTGDVVQLKTGSTYFLGWVVSVTSSSISVVKKDGTTFSGAHTLKVIRSGRRNLQLTPMATLTSLSNPLTNFNSNVYSKVLQSSAVEFSDRWRTFCDCFQNSNSPLNNTTNPYILGNLGNWRMKTSYLHLSPRSQSYTNNNTNIRADGFFTSYTPYYRVNSGRWLVDEKNWTYTSTVTEFSPFGQELENQDALGRFSAATFGYRQAFATAVAANARYRDIGFDNFEDYGFSECADNHFKFSVTNQVTNTEAHSGRHSVRVSGGDTLTMSKALKVCDPAGCTLAVDADHISTTVTEIEITGGEQPYQIDWNVIHGNPQIKFDGTNFSKLISTGSAYRMEIIVLDSKGCKVTQQVEH